MDALAGLLDGPRARGAFLLRVRMDPPWSVRVQDRAPLGMVAMVRGGAWLLPDGADPVPVRAGDLALLRGPDPYTFADDPGTAPQVVVHPGEHCTTPDGRDLSAELSLGVRTWGNSATGSVTMLIGCYQLRGEIGQRLLDALPPTLVLSGDSWGSPLVGVLAEEIAKDEPGQEVVLNRLFDLLLITAVRAWFTRPEADAPTWYRAHTDPVVGPALRLIHGDPARPWSVASLAREVGVSRAAFARRFTRLVGEAPMAYLTGWRMSLAADLLREPGATVAAVARQVGYGGAFALSAAFKRVRGISPQEHRVHAAANPAG